MNLRYLSLRLIRHFMPEGLARFLLRKRWIIQPGLESSDPGIAAERYMNVLTDKGFTISGRQVLVFGYGGRFAIGVELLKRGAAHVVLSDHLISLDHGRNRQLLPHYADYLLEDGGRVRPRPEFITLVHGDIRSAEVWGRLAPVDCVLSNSVYEHIEDVEGVTRALAGLTRPNGVQLHFVDLRDHYFKYPFEMLAYSERVWKSLLNPTSNLNRLRMPDYRMEFERYFGEVDILVLERLEKEFHAVYSRIRPEFLSDDPEVDSTTLICIIASRPLS